MAGKPPAGVGVHPDAEGFVRVLLPDFPYWHIRVQVIDVDGVPQLTGLRIDWTARADTVITSARLRRLPLRELVGMGAAVNVRDVNAALAAMRSYVDTWPQGRARPDEHFEEVAAVYRAAIANRRPPLKDIQVRWTVGRAMASKYVKRARELGYLGPAKSGVAGEVTTPKRKAAK